ncbi:MAG: T9SS type A sorting domain-containing protein [Bacteroidia bacterium]|nr:T9SS type A sorting domain-containing protein [Bacteroidia bacterium]
MREIVSIIFSLFFAPLYSFSQGIGSNWCFGDSAGISFVNSTVSPLITSMECRGSSVSLSDSSGSLLFSANTGYLPYFWAGSNRLGVVWNKNYQLMVNGDSLVGMAWYHEFLAIPDPGNDSISILFQIGVTSTQGLFYSKINPYFQNYTGIVTNKNTQIAIPDNDLADASCAVKHSNGRDWWYFVHNWNGHNDFYVFLITPFGISGPFIQSVGSNSSTDVMNIVATNSGNKLLVTNNFGLIEVLDFDRCTGVISNPITIHSEGGLPYFGAAFSPDGQLIYISNTNNIFGDSLRLFQFDLNASNIFGSRISIYTEKVPASGGLLKLGPNGKIYLACLYEYGWPYADSVRNIYNENISVIENPDILGPGCNFRPFSVYLGGKRCYWGLPNNPNFELGVGQNPNCDSLTNGIVHLENSPYEFSLSPNPCSDKITINLSDFPKEAILMRIFDDTGREVRRENLFTSSTTLNVSTLPNGIYSVNVQSGYINRSYRLIKLY